MARAKLMIDAGGAICELGLKRMDRSSLYGSTRRIGVDENGLECEIGQLVNHGRHLLMKGCTASFYIDGDGEMVGSRDIAPVGEDGKPLSKQPSTLNTPQTPGPPVSWDAFFGHVVTRVYELTPQEGSDALFDLLSDGLPRQIPFRYRKGYGESPAFLVNGAAGLFLLVAEPIDADFVGLDDIPQEIPTEDENLDDDWDAGVDLGFDWRAKWHE